jgi:hypothetical protein
MKTMSSTPPLLPPQAFAHAEQQLGDSAGIRLLLPVGRSGWAVAAGYLGFFPVLMIPEPICLVICILAIRDIRKSRFLEHPRHGMGRAIFAHGSSGEVPRKTWMRRITQTAERRPVDAC